MFSLRRLLGGIFGGLQDEIVFSVLKGAFKLAIDKVKDKAVEGTTKVVVEKHKHLKYVVEHRSELIDDIIKLDTRERLIWMNRIKLRKDRLPRPYGPRPRSPYGRNDENEMIEKMVLLRKYILEEPGDDDTWGKKEVSYENRQEIWHETLRVLAHMSPEEFDLTIEALTHDAIQQYILMAWDELEIFFDLLDQTGEQASRKIQGHHDRLRNSRAANPSSYYVIGFFIDPIGWFRNGLLERDIQFLRALLNSLISWNRSVRVRPNWTSTPEFTRLNLPTRRNDNV